MSEKIEIVFNLHSFIFEYTAITGDGAKVGASFLTSQKKIKTKWAENKDIQKCVARAGVLFRFPEPATDSGLLDALESEFCGGSDVVFSFNAKHGDFSPLGLWKKLEEGKAALDFYGGIMEKLNEFREEFKNGEFDFTFSFAQIKEPLRPVVTSCGTELRGKFKTLAGEDFEVQSSPALNGEFSYLRILSNGNPLSRVHQNLEMEWPAGNILICSPVFDSANFTEDWTQEDFDALSVMVLSAVNKGIASPPSQNTLTI